MVVNRFFRHFCTRIANAVIDLFFHTLVVFKELLPCMPLEYLSLVNTLSGFYLVFTIYALSPLSSGFFFYTGKLLSKFFSLLLLRCRNKLPYVLILVLECNLWIKFPFYCMHFFPLKQHFDMSKLLGLTFYCSKFLFWRSHHCTHFQTEGCTLGAFRFKQLSHACKLFWG